MTEFYKNGNLHSRFDQNRQSKYEHIGHEVVIDFMQNLGYTIKENDKRNDGSVNYDVCDFLAIKPNFITKEIEVETKSNKDWIYTAEEIDIPFRKKKYIFNKRNDQNVFSLILVKEDKAQFYLIPERVFRLTVNDCVGFKGLHKVKNSVDFYMPHHGCHVVRKACLSLDGSYEINDFFRIPSQYVYHYILKDGRYIIKRKALPIGY